MKINIGMVEKENLDLIKEDWDKRLRTKDEDPWLYWEIIYCLLEEKAMEIRFRKAKKEENENNISKNE